MSTKCFFLNSFTHFKANRNSFGISIFYSECVERMDQLD